MKEQIVSKRKSTSLYFEVAPHVWGTKDLFVNMYMVQNPIDEKWVLIDAGLKSSAAKIRKMAAELFGPDSRPEAILLTHGHFDHVGSIEKLADEWDVDVYCHYLELPYLSGRSAYPPPDPGVGGGLVSTLSWLYPKEPINVESKLHILPPDGSVPFLPDWQYLNTPGHSPGHVSFFRPRDKVLIAGDAITTTHGESVLDIMTQKKVLSGPPKYFTCDWEAAKVSVNSIADLNPSIVATGHGMPMTGDEMKIDLVNLSAHFDELAVPKHGRYVDDPAVANATGVIYVPPQASNRTLLYVAIGVGVTAIVALSWLALSRRKRR